MTTAETVAVMDTRLLDQNERLSRLEITVAKMADGFHPRISDAEATIAELYVSTATLGEKVAYLETQTRDAETDHYVELRRIIKVIGLTEILAGWHHPDWFDEQRRWEAACAELYRRYGHLHLEGKPLWSKPPAPPSPQTKALIAESLKRRQEA